jgi:hypothetical protein
MGKKDNEKENREHSFPADNHHQLSLYPYEKIRDFLWRHTPAAR